MKNLKLLLLTIITQAILIAIIRIFYPTTLMAEQILIISFFQFLIFYVLSHFDLLEIKSLSMLALSVLITFNIFAFSIGNVERSTSLYIVQWVSVFPEGVSSDELISKLEHKFNDVDNFGIQLRLNEHTKRRIFFFDKNRYRLTIVGKVVLFSANLLSNVFSLEEWKSRSL